MVKEPDKTSAVPESVRLDFSVRQADLIKQLFTASQDAQVQLQFALIAAGVEERDIIGGNLDIDSPYLIVSNDGGIDED